MLKNLPNMFENNSDLTHSITIEDDYDYERTFKYTRIPHNVNLCIDKTEFNEHGDNITEWQKLNALINFVIGYYDDDYYRLNADKPLFQIIKNVIKDKCNSVLNIDLRKNYFCIYDDTYGNTLGLLDLREDSVEEEIYNRFKGIIFNPKINFRYQHSNC